MNGCWVLYDGEILSDKNFRLFPADGNSSPDLSELGWSRPDPVLDSGNPIVPTHVPSEGGMVDDS